MQLHLTFGGKLIDSVAIAADKRMDKTYISEMKQNLLLKWTELVQDTKLTVEFYLDPLYMDTESGLWAVGTFFQQL